MDIAVPRKHTHKRRKEELVFGAKAPKRRKRKNVNFVLQYVTHAPLYMTQPIPEL
jgi:hypothetical protein